MPTTIDNTQLERLAARVAAKANIPLAQALWHVQAHLAALGVLS